MKRLLWIAAAAGMLYGAEAKAVFDLTSGDEEKVEKHLISALKAAADYYADKNISFESIVVISGDAYKFFISDLEHSPYAGMKKLSQKQPYLKKQFENLSDKYHVQFKMCSNGMKSRKIPKDTVYKFVETDKVKYVYLINAQAEGFAYLPVH